MPRNIKEIQEDLEHHKYVLKELIEGSRYENDDIKTLQVRESQLKDKITELTNELREAKSHC